MQPSRLSRFTRSTAVAPIELTDRDREIIRLVHRHRFLRSMHVMALINGSRQQILRRLQLLYHHGYLERPRAQLEYFHRGGSSRMVYGLGTKGARLLKDKPGASVDQQNWSEKNRTVGRMYLQHALLVSDVLVAIELACRERGDMEYIPQRDLFPTGIRWHVTIDRGRKLGVGPDAAFALEWKKADGATQRAYFFLEADRGTMPVTRRNLTQTSFRRKFLAYEATWAQGIHRTRFGMLRFRVLTMGTSKKRLDLLREECSMLQSGKGLFLFLHKDALSNPESLFDAVWSSPQSDARVSLF
ncbi:MAG TPA: replication-relaxation family protein [Candidatus Acidoferrum sp.]|nr:replication-relaxation family protein [Candidatus Acidoferrum sp.]